VNWKFLDVAAVKTLHQEQIEAFGGSYGLRDAGLLESAVLRAEMKVHYEPSATVVQVAASLGWGLIKNHAFIDGNKRIGLVSMVTFLKLNGYHLVAAADEQVDIVRRVAASEMTENEWIAWVERSTVLFAP
jgi:death-on-curing protein